MQAFLAAYFSLVDHFLIHSERELGKGYADLHLEPFLARYADVRCGYVIEAKYLKRGEAADESVVASRLEETRTQLRGYLADPGLRRGQPAARHVGLAVVFFSTTGSRPPAKQWATNAPATRRLRRRDQAPTPP